MRMITNTGHRHFRFTVIMPVYNVEKYIREAVESLLNQAIGFEENIQLIFVNDGSLDNSGSICKEYRSVYPDNIVYVEKENGGVSSARNAGIPYAEGDYINFIDPDDKWGSDAFTIVDHFFTDNPDVQFATCRMVYFEAVTGRPHHLDYTFRKTRVADIQKNYSLTTLSASKAFFKKELFDTRLFDETVRYAEDVIFVNSLLLDIQKFGLIREAVYWYRKRNDKTSSLDKQYTDPEFYKTPERVYQPLVDKSIEKYGRVIPYIQYLLITDLQWKQRAVGELPLDSDAEQEYIANLRRIAGYVDDKYIIKQKHMTLGAKAYAMRLKYGSEIADKGARLLAGDLKLTASILDARDGSLVIQGRADEKYLGKKYYIEARDNNGDIWKCDYKPYPAFNIKGIDKDITLYGYEHILALPLKAGMKYRFYLTDGEGWSKRVDFITGMFSRLTEFEDSFFAADGHIIKRFEDTIRIYDYRLRTFLASLHRHNSGLLNRYGAPKDVISVRNAAVLHCLVHKKPLWLITDSENFAEKKGAELFEFLMQSGEYSKYDIRYMVEEDSDDFQKMSRIGKIVKKGSKEHFILQAAADILISSQPDERVYNPYGKNFRYYRDLISFRRVLLVSCGEETVASVNLDKYRKNIAIITANSPETIAYEIMQES